LKQKILLLFTETIESYREQPISSIFEELDQNHEEIFLLLIESSANYVKSLLQDKERHDEESMNLFDLLQKLLYTSEIFLSADSKLSVSKLFEISKEQLIRFVEARVFVMENYLLSVLGI
jgi:hypothetical protein